MSQVDEEEFVSEETEGMQEQQEQRSSRLVPVSESIRYRKRAQAAERKNEILSEQLSRAKDEASKTAERLGATQAEKELMEKLAAAGSVDLEASLLLAKSRAGGSDEKDLDAVVESLRRDKAYLFSGGGSQSAAVTPKTAGVKERISGGRTVLEDSARRAASTGSRIDLQEYLKARRNYL